VTSLSEKRDVQSILARFWLCSACGRRVAGKVGVTAGHYPTHYGGHDGSSSSAADGQSSDAPNRARSAQSGDSDNIA